MAARASVVVVWVLAFQIITLNRVRASEGHGVGTFLQRWWSWWTHFIQEKLQKSEKGVVVPGLACDQCFLGLAGLKRIVAKRCQQWWRGRGSVEVFCSLFPGWFSFCDFSSNKNLEEAKLFYNSVFCLFVFLWYLHSKPAWVWEK